MKRAVFVNTRHDLTLEELTLFANLGYETVILALDAGLELVRHAADQFGIDLDSSWVLGRTRDEIADLGSAPVAARSSSTAWDTIPSRGPFPILSSPPTSPTPRRRCCSPAQAASRSPSFVSGAETTCGRWWARCSW